MSSRSPLAALAALILPDDPTLAADVEAAERDPDRTWRDRREDFREWGVRAASDHLAVTALLLGLRLRRALGQVDWKADAADVRREISSLLREFGPAARRPRLGAVRGDLDAALVALDLALAEAGVCILQLDNDSDQVFLILVAATGRADVLRAASVVRGLVVRAVREADDSGPLPALLTRQPAKKTRVPSKRGGRSAKDMARARAALAEATRILDSPGGWHAAGHFQAACARVVLGETRSARLHVEALARLYAKRARIEVSLHTLPHLAAVGLVDPAAVATWGARLTGPAPSLVLAPAIPRVFGRVRPFPPVSAAALSGNNERAYAELFSALAEETPARILAALDAFDDHGFAGGHRNPVINAGVVASGLPVSAFPSTVVERMWPDFPPFT